MDILNKIGIIQIIFSLILLPASAKEPAKQERSQQNQTKAGTAVGTNAAINDLNYIEEQLKAKPLSIHTSLDQVVPANRPYARKVIGELRTNIKDSQAWFGLGCFCSSARKSEEAVTAYKNALAINPKNAMALNNLGTELMSQKRLKEAEAAYMKSLSIDPSGSWTNLAEVRHQLGDTKGEQAAHEHARASGEAATIESYLRFNELLKKQNR
ncbi:tetratricopeptide repeat protein [bacterium]|jgi:Tfp pilus assembly protein PilF|nr:tetratricopeptide repeat protein [bacterium]